MKSKVIAQQIKYYLVNLAAKDKLPLDMNNLPLFELQAVIERCLPTERQRIIEAASHYLSDGDLTIAEMVEAIAKHDDETDFIDNVEGIVVWEKVENSFTCDDFLSEIGFNSDFYNK